MILYIIALYFHIQPVSDGFICYGIHFLGRQILERKPSVFAQLVPLFYISGNIGYPANAFFQVFLNGLLFDTYLYSISVNGSAFYALVGIQLNVKAGPA